MIEFTEYDMDLLVQAIEAEQCVFFLGPGATINYQRGELLDSFLGDELKKRLPEPHQSSILAYNPTDRFFVLDLPASRNKLYKPLREFYEEVRPNPMLDLLAEIPFHLAIMVTPDLSLHHAFDRKGLPYSTDYFDKAAARELPESAPISKNKPLLYSLLGASSAYETLITTHLELFETLQAMFSGERMPKDLLPKISSRNLQHVVFLGLEFDKWYYQLVLYLLRMNNADVPRTSPDSGAILDPHTREFCKTDFRINFISQDITAFVAELHQRFEVRKQLRLGSHFTIPTKEYNLARVLRLLEMGISADELGTLCLIHFPEVYREFTSGQTQSLRISLLMNHCKQRGTIGELLEFCAVLNPYLYHEWGPYDEA